MKLSVINKGFSLVEVVVALFILSVSVITIYNLILSTAVSSYDLEQRYLAKEVANNRISLINTIEKSLKPIKNRGLLRFRGVEIEAKSDPETASGRDWAARGLGEAPGVHLGPFWVPKSVRKRGPKTS